MVGLGDAMNAKSFQLVAGAIFALIALLHLARIVLGWSAVIGEWSVPMGLSWLALVVAAGLAYFGFKLYRTTA